MQTAPAELASHLTTATFEVFRTMASTDLVAEPVEAGDPKLTGYSVTSFVGFGGRFSGLLAMSYSIETARAVTAALLDPAEARDESAVVDALGEVSNMVGGGVAARVSNRGGLKLSLPTVVIGGDYRYFVSTPDQVVRVHFRFGSHGILALLALVESP